MGTESESKQPIQVMTEATAEHLDRIASIITGAVRDIAQEIGKWANDIADVRNTPEPSATEETPPAADKA